jgi:hypothetical protein
MLTTPVSASTTTYTGNGTPRQILEGANNATAGSISSSGNSQNDTTLTFGLPTGSWTGVGYQMGTTFTSIARNSDFVANGQFTGSPNPPWNPTESGDTSYISTGFNKTIAGSTTGTDYIRLQGKETVQRPTTNSNFTNNLNGWMTNIYNNSGSISPTNSWVGGEFQEYGSYQNLFYGYNRTGSAVLVADQNFTYTGTVPPDLALLSYRFYITNWQMYSGGSMTVKLILTRYTGGTQSFNLVTYPVSGLTSKPGITSLNITSYLTQTGTYRVRLYAYIYLSTPTYQTSIASVNWDDVGVYIRYNHFSSPSQAMWRQTFNFNQYDVADGKLTFKYYTNLTTLVPSTNSYITAWVNGSTLNNIYYITPFSSATVGSWGTISQTISNSVLNHSSTITFGIGVYIGTNLEINSSVNPRFYFTNVTFFIKYKPNPAFIKLGIYDDANVPNARWNIAAGTYGSGTLFINASTSTPWTGSSATFHILFNGTNGKIGYNLTSTTFSYLSTMYVRRSTKTNYCIFTVHDDTTTTWYLNYSTPTSISGYQNYNVSVYVPPDWLSGGLVTQITFGGIAVTNYATASVNSTASVIKIPASVFSPNPPRFLLVISATSPNYLGPSTVRTLLYTEVNTTNSPGPSNWNNVTYFIPKNMTRLEGVIRNASGGIPANVGSFTVSVNLYNASTASQPFTSKSWSWSRTPDHNGMFNVTLNPWSGSNVTFGASSSAALWYFAVNCTNNYEAGSGIARFTTNKTVSTITSTTLTSPGAPYSVPYGNSFTLTAQYRKQSNNGNVSSAMVNWYWSNQANTSSMTESPAYSGTYTVTIGISAAEAHYGTYNINITATKTGFATQSILVQVSVRNISTTGSAASFTVPYQTYPWNYTLQTSMTYTDVDHSRGVVGANLYVNKTCANATIVGASGIRWWYKYSGNGGTYWIFFNATNSTPTGTHAWVFNVTASKPYYQVVSFNLNGFYIRDRQTSYTASYLSKTTPWGTNATFCMTFLDQDAGGAGIPGASATCNWTNGYAVKDLGNGTYRFSLSVTNLVPQIFSVSFSFSKTHWVSISGISAQVQIRKINTELYSNSPSNTITVYWGDNQTALLIYKDLDHNVNISAASWSGVLANNTQTGANWTSSLVYNIRFNSTYGCWTLTVNGSFPVGTYTLWIHVQVSARFGYYADQWLALSLVIQPIPTSSATLPMSVLTVVWSDPGKIVVNYTDIDHHGRPILSASILVSIDPSILVSPAYNNGSGIYTVFLYTNGSQASRYPYPFTLQLSKTNYASSIISGSLQINPISTNLTLPTQEIWVAYGDQLTFNVTYRDVNHNLGISGALVDCNWTITGLQGSTDLLNGNYTFNLNSTLRGEGLFTIEINATKTNYVGLSEYYTFVIGVVPTTLTLHGTPQPAPWGSPLPVLLYYNRTGTASSVAGPVIVSTNWTNPVQPPSQLPGQWEITLNTTGLPEGTYWVNITMSKQYYVLKWLIIPVTIRYRHMKLQISLQRSVQQGYFENITIQLSDLDNSLAGVTGAFLNASGRGLSSSSCVIKELGNGAYEVDVPTSSLPIGNFTLNITVEKAHYSVIIGSGQVSFIVTSPPGLPLPTVIMIGGGSSGAVVLAILGYVMYRRRKIPFVIKKIDQSIRLINRGEVLEPVPMKTRTEMTGGILQAKLAILSKEKLEEPGKKKEKKETKSAKLASESGTEQPQVITGEAASREGIPEQKAGTFETRKEAEPGEADVALIAEELEKLETKGGPESIRETDLIKREMDELEKEAKKKKKKSD